MAALLASWGDRIQKSVFECVVDAAELDELMGRIERMIDLRTDAAHAFSLCASCEAEVRVVGQAVRLEEVPYWVV